MGTNRQKKMKPIIISHIRQLDMKVQSNDEHQRGVATLAERFAARLESFIQVVIDALSCEKRIIHGTYYYFFLICSYPFSNHIANANNSFVHVKAKD